MKLRVSSTTDIKVGDALYITCKDRRFWPRFKAWVLGQKTPVIKVKFLVTHTISNETLEVASENVHH